MNWRDKMEQEQKIVTKNIYQKTVVYYSILILVIIFVLESYFFITIQSQKRETYYRQQERMIRDVEETLYSMERYTKSCIYQFYETESTMKDIMNYLMLEDKDYIKNKLDNYYAFNQPVYEIKKRFVSSMFLGKQGLDSIHLVSYKNKKIIKYSRDGKTQVEQKLDGYLAIQDKEKMLEDGKFLMKSYILDDVTNKPIGEFHFLYNNSEITSIYNSIQKSGELLIQRDNTVFFSSNNALMFNEKDNDYQIVKGTALGFSIVSFVEKRIAGEISVYNFLILLGIGIVIFMIGELCIHFYMKRLSNRLEQIVHTMEEIKKGNLTTRLEISGKGDELDFIANNLNGMSMELKRYIEKSYLAEIGQKKAELEAIQNQVNPHFLYNTLEAIRMKAIINNDKEVGKMLYGLAIIFRSQIKENPVIPIAKELYLCKQYLELYKFRYPNRFEFFVQCPSELMEYKILKFSIQPLIENYFVHGIRSTDTDNYIEIQVYDRENDIMIEIIDNGNGMTDEEIHKKNQELINEMYHQDSIGLSNIQLRLKAEFGLSYGICLARGIDKGIKVTMNIPKK